MDLFEELQQKIKQLEFALKTYRQNGIALAEAEKNYKEAISKEVLRLRDEGMAVTLIAQVIYGLPSISQLRFERDCAEAVYKANEEAINVKKLQVRVIENQLAREWGSING